MTLDAKPRIFSSAALQTLGLAINTLVGLYITRTLARYLGVAGYGFYALAFVYLNFTAVIANFGFDAILIREVARDRERTSALVTSGVVLKLAFGAAAAAAGAAYLLLRGYPTGYTGAVIFLLLTHFVAAFDTFEVAHKARLRGGTVAAGSVLSQLLTLGVVLWGRHRGWPLEWLIAAHVFVRIPRAGLWALRLRRLEGFRWRWDAAGTHFILRESALIGLTGILWVVYFRVDTLMLEWMKGPEAVGQYAAAYKFIELSLLGSGLAMGSLGPVLAERWPANPDGFRWMYRQTIDYMGMLGALMAGVMVVLGADLIRLLFSPRFTEAVGILRILSVAAWIVYLSNATGHAMVAVGVQGKGFLTSRLVGTVLNVGLNLWWIPLWAGRGAAWATVCSEGLMLLMAPFFIRARTGSLPKPWFSLLGIASVAVAWLAYRAAGGQPLEANWPARLAGLAVLAAALAFFVAAHRRQFGELLTHLRPGKATAGPE